MRWSSRSRRIVPCLGIAAFFIPTAFALGQQDAPKAADASIQAINDAYDAQRLQIERQRLESLARLAARQRPAAAAATYEQLFRLTIANNLFVDAGQTAEQVVKAGSTSATTIGLAHLVKIIAETDRGEHEKSLESVRRVVEGSEKEPGGKPHPAILISEKVELCDLYYQRLVHAGQLEIAKKAFQLLKDHVRDPALVEFVADRLKRLDLVGKPAPAIQGTDLDGKPFKLADAKGKVVLIVFWATWCLPCADEIEEFQRVAESYRGKGLQVVGINVDHMPDDGRKLEAVLPNIRRFLLDYNVRWPTLINGSGDANYVDAYGVTAIPSNTLIGRDGKVVQIDLVRKNLAATIARVVGE
jgi:thiol-disulfide isomerase/thioredoxin